MAWQCPRLKYANFHVENADSNPTSAVIISFPSPFLFICPLLSIFINQKDKKLLLHIKNGSVLL